VSFVILIEALLLLFAPRAAAGANEAEVAVRDAFSAFRHAFVTADLPVLRALLTDDYVHTNGRSGEVLDRQQWLGYMTARRTELDQGSLIIDTYLVDDLEVRIQGEAADSAVVTGVAISSGRRHGAPFESRVRFTNLWVQRDGAWRRAAFHD
jgi:hypothetical protein